MVGVILLPALACFVSGVQSGSIKNTNSDGLTNTISQSSSTGRFDDSSSVNETSISQPTNITSYRSTNPSRNLSKPTVSTTPSDQCVDDGKDLTTSHTCPVNASHSWVGSRVVTRSGFADELVLLKLEVKGKPDRALLNKFPLHAVVQTLDMTSVFNLPLVTQDFSYNIAHKFTCSRSSKIMAGFGAGNETEPFAINVTVSTRSPNPIHVFMKVSPMSWGNDLSEKPLKKRATPFSSQLFRYIFPEGEKEALLVVNNGHGPCGSVVVQDYECPIQDTIEAIGDASTVVWFDKKAVIPLKRPANNDKIFINVISCPRCAQCGTHLVQNPDAGKRFQIYVSSSTTSTTSVYWLPIVSEIGFLICIIILAESPQLPRRLKQIVDIARGKVRGSQNNTTDDSPRENQCFQIDTDESHSISVGNSPSHQPPLPLPSSSSAPDGVLISIGHDLPVDEHLQFDPIGSFIGPHPGQPVSTDPMQARFMLDPGRLGIEQISGTSQMFGKYPPREMKNMQGQSTLSELLADGSTTSPVLLDQSGFVQDLPVVAFEPQSNAILQLGPDSTISTGSARRFSNASSDDTCILEDVARCTKGAVNECSVESSSRTSYASLQVIASAFFIFPVAALVIRFSQKSTPTERANQCFANFECSKALGSIPSFNSLCSNFAYVLYGTRLLLVVFNRKRKLQQVTHKEVDLQKPAQLGVPQSCDISYAMATALISQGVVSALYHVCPNKWYYLFDTGVLFALVFLPIIKLYSARRDKLPAERFYFMWAAVIAYTWLSAVTRPSWVFWIVFIVSEIFLFPALSLQLYYSKLINFDLASPNTWHNVVDVVRSEWAHGHTGLIFKKRFTLLFAGNMINVAVSLVGLITQAYPVSSWTLFLCIVTALSYFGYYFFLKYSFDESFTRQTLVFTAIGIACWSIALTFFFMPAADWSLSAPESRNLNRSCALMGFFDLHDLWHIFSASALYFTFMVVISIDDGLKEVPSTDINIF